MASNQLRVNCTCNYHSCWVNLLIQTNIAVWSKGNFWRSLFLEPRACNARNHTNQNNSVIFKAPIFKNIC